MSDRFRQVRDDYARLEPGRSDTWNPLHDDVELEHRVELFRCLAGALRAAGADPGDLRVLDVGCGTGRSTRMYLDVGVPPARVTGVDLREGALDAARAMHPGIRYERTDGERLPAADGAVDWVSVCTVLSSVRAPDARAHIAAEAFRVLRPGGHVFAWDLLVANDFAGGDPLDLAALFAAGAPVWTRDTCVAGFRARDFGAAETGAPTHRAVLRRK